MYVTFTNVSGSDKTYKIDFSKPVRIHTVLSVDILSIGAAYVVFNPVNGSLSGQPKDISASPALVFPSGFSINVPVKVGNPAMYMNEYCARMASALIPNGASFTIGFEYI